MKKFSEWTKMRENVNAMQPGGETPLAQADGPQTGLHGAVDEMQVKAMVKKRLNALFQELQGYNLPRVKAVQMLTVILQEFQAEFGLNRPGVNTAVRTAFQQ